MQAETRFKMRVRADLNKIPCSYFLKTQMLSIIGIPDILGCINGQFIALELKVGSRLSGIQRYVLAKICKAGGYAVVVDPDNWDLIHRTLRDLAPKVRTPDPEASSTGKKTSCA